MQKSNKEFGALLKMNRQNLGLTLTEAARILKMKSGQQLHNTEAGRAPLPVKYLKNIAKEYKVDLNDLTVFLTVSYFGSLRRQLGINDDDRRSKKTKARI